MKSKDVCKGPGFKEVPTDRDEVPIKKKGLKKVGNTQLVNVSIVFPEPPKQLRKQGESTDESGRCPT